MRIVRGQSRTQASRGHQAIRGWPGPSADGLGPRLAPNRCTITRQFFSLGLYFLESSALPNHHQHVFYLLADFEVCSCNFC